jgi:hypothetical protein
MSQVVLTFTTMSYDCELQSPLLLLKPTDTIDNVSRLSGCYDSCQYACVIVFPDWSVELGSNIYAYSQDHPAPEDEYNRCGAQGQEP